MLGLEREQVNGYFNSVVKMKGWQLHIFYFLVSFFILVSQVCGDCSIVQKQFNDCKGVITTDGKYLRTSSVKETQTLIIYHNKDIMQIECSNGAFSPPFPEFKKKVSASAECPMSDRVDVRPLTGHRDCQGTMYQAGYKLHNENILELYRSCYDTKNYVSRYSEAFIYPSSEDSAIRPECEFTKDGAMSDAVFRSIKKEKVIKTFSELFKGKYDDKMKNPIYQMDRGHLVAANDFLTYDQKAATYKMINVIPQFHGIQGSGNWYKIEQFVRTLAGQNLPSIHVRSGSYGVLELPDSNGVQVEAFLYSGSKFPVPAWMYKLVRNSLDIPIFAVVVSNDPFATVKPHNPSFCIIHSCPSGFPLTTKNDIASKGHYYCCDPHNFKPHPIQVVAQPTAIAQPPSKKRRIF